jgi:hypothetical protein
VESLALDLIEVSTRYRFAFWLSMGTIKHGWARSDCGDSAEGLARIQEGIRDYQATGSVRHMPFFLSLKAEALHAAAHTREALVSIREAGRWPKLPANAAGGPNRSGSGGVFLAALGADQTQIKAAFNSAIRTARQQKSISLLKRAEASYGAYLG